MIAFLFLFSVFGVPQGSILDPPPILFSLYTLPRESVMAGHKLCFNCYGDHLHISACEIGLEFELDRLYFKCHETASIGTI